MNGMDEGRWMVDAMYEQAPLMRPTIRVSLLRTTGKHDVVPDAIVGPCQRYVRPSLVAGTPHSAGSVLRKRLAQGE